jgi:hypothetical protein
VRTGREDTADNEDAAGNEDTADNAMGDAWFRWEILAGLAAGKYGYGLACGFDGRCVVVRMVALVVVPGGWRFCWWLPSCPATRGEL